MEAVKTNYQILVNKNKEISNNWIESIDLIEIKSAENKVLLIEKTTYKNYLSLEMFLKEKYNIIIGIESAYRDHQYQQELYERFVVEYGKEYADKIVAPPKTSEHHTGLALDINIFINDKWPETNQEIMKHQNLFKTVHQYLHLYGFILRYLEGKEEITEYPYEPWHIRYVGKEIATEIYQNNWTLEEFYKIKNVDKIL